MWVEIFTIFLIGMGVLFFIVFIGFIVVAFQEGEYGVGIIILIIVLFFTLLILSAIEVGIL